MLKIFIFWIIAIAIAITGGVTALGAIAKNKSPEIALSLSPKNGFAAEAAAVDTIRAYVAENQGEFPKLATASSSALAVRAFKSEPTTADALAVIALSQTGNVRREMMRRAFELSRRQQLVTGWMIIDSGKRGDISDILEYYDTTLRTSSTASRIVIPVMANALANEGFVEPFAKLLSRNPVWAAQFWRQIVQTPDSLVNASKLRSILEKDLEGRGVYQDPALVYALVKKGELREAQNLYEYLLPKSQQATSLIRNSNFKLESKFPPFDWQVFSSGEYGAVISKDSMNLSAIANSGGLMARQVVSLPKEALTLDVELATSSPKEANIYVEFVCTDRSISNGSTIRIALSNKLTRQKINNQQGVCPYYWVNIFGKSSGNINGFDVAIKKFEISKRS